MNIKIYSTPTCPYCVMVKKYLETKGFKYEDVDVSANASLAEELQKKSGQLGVPVTIISKDNKEEIIVGFDKERIDTILEIK